MNLSFLLAEAAPAGGAEMAQVVGATAAATLLTGLLIWAGLGHRSGKVKVLGRLGAISERAVGLPAWAALPAAISNVGLLAAVFGMYWDISLHIDNGRDAGPLANPSHYFILLGLFAIFAAGWLAIVLPTEKPGRAAVKITRGWHAPVGGILLMACSSFALAGFPLDDVSHRLFGQDVTLWGPTHMMLIGGAGMSLVGILVLIVEGHAARKQGANVAGARAVPSPGPSGIARVLALPHLRVVRMVAACGGLLVGLSTFQGEFDFGVPQFRLAFEPVLLAIAGGMGLVAARATIGRGAALGAVAFFWLVRGILAVLVGGVFGEVTPHLPLYLGMALLVEGAALFMPARGWRFGAVAGFLVGSVGILTEAWWSHVAMPVEWPSHFLGEALALGIPSGIAAGLLGAFLAAGLNRDSEMLAGRRGWAPAAGALAAIIAILAFVAPTTVPGDVRAELTLRPAGEGHATAEVRFDPPEAVRDADWLDAIAWQTGGVRVLTPLREIRDGVWRAEQALPITGEGKTLIRFHRGREMGVVPVYLPADPAIPAREIPARPQVTRELVADKLVLQRERKEDVAGWLWGAAGLTVGGLSLALLLTLGWGVVRLGRSAGVDEPAVPPAVPSAGPEPAREPAPAGRS